ncbi:MAG: metal-dependent hydrolase [Archaeoglobaceae archaeon]
MPDWLAHIAFAFVLCVVLGMRFKTFRENRYVALVMVGSLVPDLFKITILFDWLGYEVGEFLAPLHTPAGALLSAGMISLLFYGAMLVFSLLVVGVASHFALDLLLGHVSGGMLMLFPFSWQGYQLGLIQSDNYWITLVLVVVAVMLLYVQRKRDL